MMPGIGYIGGRLSIVGGYSWPGAVDLIEEWDEDRYIVYSGIQNLIWIQRMYPRFHSVSFHTANEGPVRILYICLVPIYVFPEMKLCGLVISKKELKCSVSQFPNSCICEQFIYSRIGLPILLQLNRQTDPGNI
jgi:hypothetical protein